MARQGRTRVRLARAAIRAVARDEAVRVVTNVTRRTMNRAKVLSPVDKGLMRASHVMSVVARGSRVIGTITVLVPYGIPVHEGWTRTLPIRPVRKQALKFSVGGQTVIVKAVYTPVTVQGRPWLLTALYQVAVPAGFRVTPY